MNMVKMAKILPICLLWVNGAMAGVSDRVGIKAGLSGSSPLLALEYHMIYDYVGMGISAGAVAGNSANFFPLRIFMILPLSNQRGIEPYALLGGGMSWTVPTDAIGAHVIQTPSLEFGAGLNKRLNEKFGVNFEMSQSAELVQNEWTDRKDWLFFQYWKIGVWFEL